MNEETSTKKFTTSQVVFAALLSIVVLVAAQLLSLSIGELPLELGVSPVICNILAGALYAAFAILGVRLLCRKLLKTAPDELRISRFRVRPIWVLSALAMPALVLLLAVWAGGHWELNSFSPADRAAAVTGAVFFYGLATGIVEELIFRGVIMGCLERRTNIQIAIVAPSVLFGLLHVFGNDLDLASTIQLLIAGSIVGILFSLIAWESGSIWNSAVVHGVWNMVMVGGILRIGEEADSGSILNFIFEDKSFFLSGGDFGVEASVISIFVYLLFILLAAVRIRKKSGRLERA